MTQDGRIEIPRELREELGLQPGNILELQNQAGTLVACTANTDGTNEYSSLSNPSSFDVTGMSSASPVTVSGETALKQGTFFHAEKNESGESGKVQPGMRHITIVAGSSTEEGDVYVPQVTETTAHDDSGNLTGDSRWMYRWTENNRLREMETEAEATSGIAAANSVKLQFDYDYVGRRIRKRVYTPAGAPTPSTTIRYVYDGWNCVAELNGSNSKAFVWGPDLSGGPAAGGVGGLLYIQDLDGFYAVETNHCVAYDGNGNVMAVVEGEYGYGSTDATYEYDPFGKLLRDSGSYAETNPFRFSTKYADNESGLIYYGFRYYDPQTGRWLSRDPIGERGGLNLYGFVGNHPVGRIDFLGLDTYIIVIGKDKDKAKGGLQDKFNKSGELQEAAIRKRAEFSSADDKIVKLTSGKASDFIDSLKANERIVEVIFFSHGAPERILLDGHPPAGSDFKDTQITVEGGKTGGASFDSTGVHELPKENLLADLKIKIYACKTRYVTGSEEERTATSIADKLAEELNARVLSSDAGTNFTGDGVPMIRKKHLTNGATGFEWRYYKDGKIKSEPLPPKNPSIFDIFR